MKHVLQSLRSRCLINLSLQILQMFLKIYYIKILRTNLQSWQSSMSFHANKTWRPGISSWSLWARWSRWPMRTFFTSFTWGTDGSFWSWLSWRCGFSRSSCFSSRSAFTFLSSRPSWSWDTLWPLLI